MAPGSKHHTTYEEFVCDCKRIIRAGYPLTINTKTTALRLYSEQHVSSILSNPELDTPDENSKYDDACGKFLVAYESWVESNGSVDFNIDCPQLCAVGLGSKSLSDTLTFDVAQKIIATLIRGGEKTVAALHRFFDAIERHWLIPDESSITTLAATVVGSIKDAAQTVSWIRKPTINKHTPRGIVARVLQFQSATASVVTAPAADAQHGSVEEIIGFVLCLMTGPFFQQWI